MSASQLILDTLDGDQDRTTPPGIDALMPDDEMSNEFDGGDDDESTELSLEDQLHNAIEQFNQDRIEFWQVEDNKHFAPVIELVDRAANLVVGASDTMIAPRQIQNLPQLRSRLLQLSLLEYALETIQVAVAREYSTDVAGKAERCFELAELVVENQPSENVLRYLRRMSRCYVNGFYPETVIVCRAVLEAALNTAFDRHGVSRPYKLEQKINRAGQEGWISAESRSNADAVRQRGNTAVHKDPTVTTQVLETIIFTMEVVRQLAASYDQSTGDAV